MLRYVTGWFSIDRGVQNKGEPAEAGCARTVLRYAVLWHATPAALCCICFFCVVFAETEMRGWVRRVSVEVVLELEQQCDPARQVPVVHYHA